MVATSTTEIDLPHKRILTRDFQARKSDSRPRPAGRCRGLLLSFRSREKSIRRRRLGHRARQRVAPLHHHPHHVYSM